MGSFGTGMPMNAGHQMDLHHLYDMVLELSDVLKNNREVTKNIVSSAEEIMVCGHATNKEPERYTILMMQQKHGSSDDASPAMQRVNDEISGMFTLALAFFPFPLCESDC